MGFHDRNGVYHAFHKTIPLPLLNFRIASSGDVGNIAAIGGALASDSASGNTAVTGAASTISQSLTWAASSVSQVLMEVPLPDDFDGRSPVLVEVYGGSGTTNAFSFTVTSNWDGGADVTDTATGIASATNHVATATIDPSDIPDGARTVSIALTPAAHTTNAFVLKSARIKYAPKVN